jgi:hypothetical protein
MPFDQTISCPLKAFGTCKNLVNQEKNASPRTFKIVVGVKIAWRPHGTIEENGSILRCTNQASSRRVLVASESLFAVHLDSISKAKFAKFKICVNLP